MQPIKNFHKPAIKIIGIEVRTNNAAEATGSGKIGSQWQKFFQENIGAKIPHRVDSEILYAIYTDYVSDVNGEYSFILGQEVSSFDEVPEGLVAKVLPATKNAVFSSRGPMPAVVIDLWQYIWGLKPNELGGERAYLADYEVYDTKSMNPADSPVEVFLSIK